MPRKSKPPGDTPTCACGRKFCRSEHRCADCGQQRMDWSKRRIDKTDLKLARLGDPLARLILRELDEVLGEWPSIDLTIDDLREICEMKRTAFYQRLNHIKELGLVSVEDLAGTTKKRWRIGRANLAELARHHGRAELVTTGEPPVQVRPSVRHADGAVRQADRSVRNTDGPVRQADGRVRHADGDTLHRARAFPFFPDLSSPSPSSTLSVDRGWGAAAAEMLACGVSYAVDAIEQARDRGCSPDDVLAIVAHFRSCAVEQGWSAGALQRRVAKAMPGVPPDQGSWPRSRTVRSDPEQELARLTDEHGAELERLSAAEVEQLARRALRGQPGLWSLFRMQGAEQAVKDQRIRRRLLAQLKRQLQPAGVEHA